MNISPKRLTVVALAAAVALAACGGDDDSDSAGTSIGTGTAGPTAQPTDTGQATATSSGTGQATATPSGTAGGTATGGGAGDVDYGSISGTLIGSGASSQAAAMQGWQAGFQALATDATVEYDPVGSGGGRETFLAGGADFAGSDAYLDDEELAESVDRCAGDQGAVNLPHYISPIAVAYNLPDLEGTTLQLSPETLAGIFANEITSWDDAAIAADNPDVDLPATTINPVHRSDESGTTANFTDYLSQVAPDVWTFGSTQVWDAPSGPGGGEGAPQTSGVVSAISAGAGSIGYADASQIGDLPAAAIGVGSEFVEYSPEAAAKIFSVSARAPGRDERDFAFDLARDTAEAGVYPIVLVSYHVVCLQYDDQGTADLVKAFMTYVGSEDGQQAAAAAAGSAPISPELSAELQAVVAEISAA